MSSRCAGCCRPRGLRSMPMCISCARRRCSRRSPPRSPSCSRRRSSASAWRACSRATISSRAETLAYFSKRPPLAAARFRFRARLRQAPCPDARARSRPCWLRSNSNATCCGRCWMRSIMPMSRRGTFRPAPSCRRSRARHGRPGAVIPAEARPRLPRGVRLVHNEAQGGWVLLAPERVFKADADRRRDHQALHRRSDLRRDHRRLGQDLSSAPRERILADVSVLLRWNCDTLAAT